MFTVLAKLGHFSKASELLHISQPALSRAIQELESQIGGLLFVRSTRQLMLSDEGKRFLPMAQRMLNDMEQMTQDLKTQTKGVRGMVTIALGTAFGTVLMPHVVKRFKLKYPDVQVRLIDDNSGGVTARVQRAEVDIGIGSTIGDTAALKCEKLATAAIGLLANPDFFDLHDGMDAAQLSALPLLSEPDDTSILTMLRLHGSALVGQMQHGVEISSLAIQLAFVQAGVGVGVLSALGASHPVAQGMQFVPVKPAIDRTLFLMTQRTRILSFAATELIATIHETLHFADELALSLHPLVRLQGSFPDHS